MAASSSSSSCPSGPGTSKGGCLRRTPGNASAGYRDSPPRCCEVGGRVLQVPEARDPELAEMIEPAGLQHVAGVSFSTRSPAGSIISSRHVHRDWRQLVVRPRNRRYAPVERRGMTAARRANPRPHDSGETARNSVRYGRLMRQTQCSMKRPSANR